MRRHLPFCGAGFALASLCACGEGPADEERDLVPQEESRCLSCDANNTTTQSDPSVTSPKVIVSPTELMFYPSTPDSAEFGPKPVTVINLTEGMLAVTSAQIGDDPKQEQGGRAYFSVEELSDKVFLDKGEQMSLDVYYLGSTEQQSAVLIITTTDPIYHTLTVFLTGKYFVGS